MRRLDGIAATAQLRAMPDPAPILGLTTLGVRDRAAAIVFAYDHRVVTPGTTPPSAP